MTTWMEAVVVVEPEEVTGTPVALHTCAVCNQKAANFPNQDQPSIILTPRLYLGQKRPELQGVQSVLNEMSVRDIHLISAT